MNLYWGIYDDYTVRTLEPRGKNPILIRVLETSYKGNNIPYEIETINKYKNILELYFDDISDYSERYINKFSLFNKDMAQELVKFINENIFDEVVVHCSAGISRSSAIMICISRILGLKTIEENIYKCGMFYPNTLVINEFSKIRYTNNKYFYEHNLINTNGYLHKEDELDVLLS